MVLVCVRLRWSQHKWIQHKCIQLTQQQSTVYELSLPFILSSFSLEASQLASQLASVQSQAWVGGSGPGSVAPRPGRTFWSLWLVQKLQ